MTVPFTILYSIRNIQKAQSLIGDMLPLPVVKCAQEGDTIIITQISDWALDGWWGYEICVELLRALSGSRDMHKQLSFIRKVRDTGNLISMLKSSALLSEACVAYCQLRSMYLEPHTFIPVEDLHEAFLCGSSPLELPRRQSKVWIKFRFWMDVLMSSYDNA